MHESAQGGSQELRGSCLEVGGTRVSPAGGSPEIRSGAHPGKEQSPRGARVASGVSTCPGCHHSFPQGNSPRQDTPKAGWARQGKCPQSFTATTQGDALTPKAELPAHPKRKPTGSNTCSPAAKLLSECVHNQKSFGLRTDTLVNKAIRIRSSSIIISWQPRINKQLRKKKQERCTPSANRITSPRERRRAVHLQ